MSKFKMYHGTTYEGGIDIPIHGFNTKNQSWFLSDEQKVYFINPDSVENNEDIKGTALKKRCLEMANEQGLISSALQNNPSQFSCVLEFVINNSEDPFYDEFENDNSCENSYCSDQCDINFINDLILNHKDKIKIFRHWFYFYPRLSLFYLTGLSQQYLNDSNLTDNDLEALDKIRKSNCYFNDLFDGEELTQTEKERFNLF